jgi:glycosyltransferase involved in cell wall biosynthesis
MTDALAEGDLAAAREIAEEGRGAEGGPPGPLRHLLAFLDGLEGEARQRFLAAAARMRERVVFTGRLVHEELADLLPVCEALVVPSTFPEAYGMVAAEAACCGTLPISADHSGLAEVSRTLEAAVPREVAPWLRFRLDDEAVQHLATCLVRWLGAPAPLRERTRRALTRFARDRFSWDGVAAAMLAAAEGRLDDLPRVNGRNGAQRGHLAWRGGRHPAPTGRRMSSGAHAGYEKPTSAP